MNDDLKERHCAVNDCQRRLLTARIEALEADRDRWHKVAMDAGAVTCADGTHIFPLRDRIEALEAQRDGLLMQLAEAENANVVNLCFGKEQADRAVLAEAQLAEVKERLAMTDATLMLERGFGIDTHETMLALSKRMNEENFKLKAQLADARKALEASKPEMCDEGDHPAGSNPDKCFACFVYGKEDAALPKDPTGARS